MLRKIRNMLYLSKLSFLVNWRKRSDLDVIRRVNLKKNMTLLEVGGRSDSLLGDLRELGYSARGVNLFVPKDLYDRFGVFVERKPLAQIRGKFDVILFRHSLEHMPIDELRVAREHIKGNGSCVVCIPLLGWAWQAYATDWADLDAPRHRFVHSSKSFALLAEQSRWRIEKVVFDSTEFQFWASDSYQRNVPLIEMTKPTRIQSRRMRGLAEALNVRGKGDTAQFYLKPA
jgi:hypothetical protein